MHRNPSCLFFAAVLAVLYAGLMLGVSFLATPVKFLAPSLTLPVALDVGRQTFMVFNWLELLCSLALFVLTALAGRRRLLIPAASIAVLVLFQTLWLLPVLDARVGIILQGDQPPASQLHNLYIAVDLLKLALLVSVAVIGFRANADDHGRD